MTHDVDTYLAGKPPAAVELFRRFRALVLATGECEERVHRTEVAWADRRVFAAAFIISGRLEVAIDLLRLVDHPALLQSFPTTRRVYTHRFSFTAADQLDADIAAWLVEAHDDVGPGTR
ncbi:DUF5655 domain-containing protein [Arthrobacter sp. S39]|uniref:DUF5655 domain-containing protein n=1 Tax=Arthrobacter sp. S39 TaxID=2509720 RepID=UPI001037B010|nr:DUF5655 domain-containing protein [Arthrobacter sp. S39]TAP43562.1 hypothetical protein EYS21_12030 [Arthrobacter sp. S39]